MAAITEAQFLGSADLTSHSSLRTDRVDGTGKSTAEAQYGTRWGAGNANDFGTALQAIHKWFRGTASIGNGTGGIVSIWNKASGNEINLRMQTAGILRAAMRLLSDQTYAITKYDAVGAVVGTTQYDNSANWLMPANLTVQGDFLVSKGDARGTLGDGTSTPIMALNGQLSGDKRIDFNTAGINNWIMKQLGTSRNFEIGRRDAAGAAVDIPFSLNWTDGGVSLAASGGKVGFFGVTPVVRVAAYTPTNVTTDRSYDANSTTLDELADVVGTMIADLQSYGLLQ